MYPCRRTRSAVGGTELLRGEAAWRILAAPEFVAAWRDLEEQCPWATVFQSPGFVITWYDVYRTQFEPVLVVGRDHAGHLVGLLLLALSHDGQLVAAGTHHAEYQVWLSTPDESDAFLREALKKISAELPQQTFRLKYIPAIAPLRPLRSPGPLRRRIELFPHRRPLTDVNVHDVVAQSFRKSGNKSRINRLKRLGKLEFVRLRDVAALDRHLDDLIDMYDFRQGAAHGALPFEADARKREFHRRIMQDHPELVHATVLTCGDKAVAGHWGWASGRREVHVSMLAHSPFHASHSPGKLALMYLLDRLRDEGFGALDLTPGGDSWKDRFAIRHDTVYEMRLYPTLASRLFAIVRRVMENRTREAGATVGFSGAKAKALLRKMRRPLGQRALLKLQHAIGGPKELRVFAIDLRRRRYCDCNPLPPQIDNLRALLKFRPAEPWQSRQNFLSSAMKRIERSEHVFTISDERHLLHYGWLIDKQESSLSSELNLRFRFPVQAPVLYDFYTMPAARGQKLYQQNLAHIISRLTAVSDSRYAFISALSQNTASIGAVLKAGAEQYCSIQVRTGLWRRQSPAVTLHDNASGLPALQIIEAPRALDWMSRFAARNWRIGYLAGLSWDWLHRVNTSTSSPLQSLVIDSVNRLRGIDYEPTPVPVISRFLSFLSLPWAQYSFVDFGCGKGRVVLLASRFAFKQVVGVDFSYQLCQIATHNLDKWNKRSVKAEDVSICCVDATQFVIPENACILYFYNPFNLGVLREVIDNIIVSFRSRERDMYIVMYALAPQVLDHLRTCPNLVYAGGIVAPSRLLRGDIEVFRVIANQLPLGASETSPFQDRPAAPLLSA